MSQWQADECACALTYYLYAARFNCALERVGEPQSWERESECRHELPLIALIPEGLDDEAFAADQAGLPVVRFVFDRRDDMPRFRGSFQDLVRPCNAMHRGFMLTGEQYHVLFKELMASDINLIVSPQQYEDLHYYPNSYPFLAAMSPHATWVQVESLSAVCEELFADVIEEVKAWGCRYVLIKDYVKSLKDQSKRFMKVRVDHNLAESCCNFVAARGHRFNRGVVLKEWVEMAHYSGHREAALNEWRLFFARGQLLAQLPNSFQDKRADQVPLSVVEWAKNVATCLGSPYLTIDVAEGISGWFCLEAGDGGVSGPAPGQDLPEHWAALRRCFRRQQW